ncbi:PH domain-containing protein [Clostridium perfringens]|uniref:PH domain-containing protein n=1 Tax=Clostridium perfringens TaxID=1502 RepID=UPI0039EBD23A
MSKFYDEAIKKLDYDERPLCYLKCSLLTFVCRRGYRPGILIATNKRVFFYELNLGLEHTESFLYEDISSIEEREGILRKSIVMNVNGEVVKIGNIMSGNVQRFMSIVKDNIKVGRV